MNIGILFRIISLFIITLLFVAVRKAERNKKYKTAFALYVLMAVVCVALFFSAWRKDF